MQEIMGGTFVRQGDGQTDLSTTSGRPKTFFHFHLLFLRMHPVQVENEFDHQAEKERRYLVSTSKVI